MAPVSDTASPVLTQATQLLSRELDRLDALQVDYIKNGYLHCNTLQQAPNAHSMLTLQLCAKTGCRHAFWSRNYTIRRLLQCIKHSLLNDKPLSRVAWCAIAELVEFYLHKHQLRSGYADCASHACTVMHALGGPSTSSASTDALIKLLLDVADALLELLMTASKPSALQASLSGCSDSPAASGADETGDQAAGFQQAGSKEGAGVTKKSLVLVLRVLGRALASPGAVPREAMKHARAFVQERYGLLGDVASWPAQSAALQVCLLCFCSSDILPLLLLTNTYLLLLAPPWVCCQGKEPHRMHEVQTHVRCRQMLYSLPHAQRTARRLLSAEQGKLAEHGSVPAAVLARCLLLLGAMAQGYQAERTAFLQRLAAQRSAAGPAPEPHAKSTQGAQGGEEATSWHALKPCERL